MNKNNLLESAFDSENFRSQGHQLIDQLADLLAQTKQAEIKVTESQNPDHLFSILDNQEQQSSSDFFQSVIDYSIKVHHPHYIGHQVSAPLPISVLASAVSSFLNNGMGIYEMGEGATALEKKVVQIFCNQIGYKNGDGILTSGGTLANLTALLSARARYQEIDIWNDGTSEQYCIMVSEMAHYCVDRAVRIMGWGDQGIIKVPVDESYKMDISKLPSLYQKAIDNGFKVLAIVGSAPSTATGTYDDLSAIADFCQVHKVWYHIDGAHGGPAVFSEKYRYLMAGSERADSIVIDAHKMMLTPALATALLFKNQSDSYNTFSQKAYYLWESQEEQEWHNLARRTFECTKLMMSVKIYVIINEYGIGIFDAFLTRQYDLAREFANLIRESPDFELAVDPHSNIVCFRFNNTTGNLSDVNRSLRKQMLEDGTYYIVQTELDDGLYLRVTLMNPLTTIEHLKGMLDKVKSMVTKEI